MNTENIYSEIPVDENTALEVGLTKEEYKKVLEILGRVPTYTELGVFGVMWSEHCSYKNSILQLKTLPRSGGRLLVEAGEENAGLVDIGNSYAIAFKIESHNHPSAIEPFQGAATGVGGILRDIFTMGARPVAALNSLRFGELTSERTKFLLSGVVEGISHYGNSFGVPTVGGEVYFENCYHDNPLVNAMAVGIVHVDKTASAAAKGKGNPVYIVGSGTGRDGIHGASLLASREFDEQTENMRPTVQVGDPFAEKLLLEATLELIESGVVVGIQDMGAAGISCSTSEMSARTEGTGMDVNLDLVPLREDDMTAYEIMLSESQERMLVVIEKGREEEAQKICEKWDVPFTQIGTINDTGLIKVWRNGKYVCEMPAESLVLGGGAPQYVRESKKPEYLEEMSKFDISSLKTDLSVEEIFDKLLGSYVIASKRWVYEQYDSQVRTNTISIKGDAAIIRLKELPGKAIAVSTDCNSIFTYLNPYEGAKAAVAEAARNVACTGAKPVAVTNCLNFGDPYDPEVYWQFKEVIRGMGDICRAFDTPVTGGNVSFHNESRDNAIFPTPVIGMLGIIDDLDKTIGAGFIREGDEIYIIGNSREELGGSRYLKAIYGKIAGDAPILDIDEEKRMQEALLEMIDEEILQSAHDCSEGGLLIALAEKAIFSGSIGARIDLGDNPKHGRLFGESHSRVIVTILKENAAFLKDICGKHNVEFTKIGETQAGAFEIKGLFTKEINQLVDIYENALPKAMSKLPL
ncbi:MAG: phosphoribosylformylglycinamidine synthase subunit PurL [Candidatus Kapaibacterium sp.]